MKYGARQSAAEQTMPKDRMSVFMQFKLLLLQYHVAISTRIYFLFCLPCGGYKQREINKIEIF
jgi:hypothetical protein